jgi:hypothetical protein
MRGCIGDSRGYWIDSCTRLIRGLFCSSRKPRDTHHLKTTLGLARVRRERCDQVQRNVLGSETITDVSDHEEHLLSLENVQQGLEMEYRRLQSRHPDLLAYERIVGWSGKDPQA